MELHGPPLLARCSACHESRILSGLAAAFASDALAQGLHAPCLLSPGCPGSLTAMAAPAPLQARPLAPRAGRHVAACPGCQVPLLHDYLYGYGSTAESAPCPNCGHDLGLVAWQEWPRCEDGAHALDLRVSLACPRRADARPEARIEVREVAPLLRQA